MKKLATIFLLSLCLYYGLTYIPHNQYDKAMGLRSVSKIYMKLFDRQKYEEYLLFKRNFEQIEKSPNTEAHSAIPKIIHQIWIGGNNIPQQYQYYNSTWKKLNPDWNIIIWEDEDIKKLDPDIIKLINQARSFAEKADIMRLDILKKYGGVYVDMDTLALKPFDKIIQNYEFVAVTAATDENFEVTNSLIASSINNPIINNAIEYLKNNWKNIEEKFDASSSSKTFHGLARRRTMYPLEYSVYDHLRKHPADTKVKVMPINFCNPFYKDVSNFIHKLVHGNYQYSIDNDTYCVHFNRKYNSLLSDNDFLLGVFDGNYAYKVIYKYLTGKNIRNKNLEASYSKNNPTKIEFSVQPKIPLIIHLVNQENKDLSLLEKSLKKHNEDFMIKIWTKNDLREFSANQNMSDEGFGLNIVNRYGGIYVANDYTPNEDLYEYANKYKFIVFVKHKNSLFGDLEFSDQVIGSIASQKIISETINEYSNSNGSAKLNELLKDNYYKFWQVEGPVICLPDKQ